MPVLGAQSVRLVVFGLFHQPHGPAAARSTVPPPAPALVFRLTSENRGSRRTRATRVHGPKRASGHRSIILRKDFSRQKGPGMRRAHFSITIAREPAPNSSPACQSPSAYGIGWPSRRLPLTYCSGLTRVADARLRGPRRRCNSTSLAVETSISLVDGSSRCQSLMAPAPSKGR